MAENVLPEDTSGSALLKVQASSKLAFGATTVALVALASSGTAVLVNHGTSSMAGPTALPGGALLPDGGSSTSSVVVDRAPGTYGTKTAAAKVDPTVKALRAALAQRAKPGKRTLIAPLVQLGGTVTTPALGGPSVTPPAAVTPPASAPIFSPPVTAPDRAALPHNGPVATPADRPDTVDAVDAGSQETRKGGKHQAKDTDKKSENNKAERTSKGKSGADSEDAGERSVKGKQARGRHSR